MSHLCFMVLGLHCALVCGACVEVRGGLIHASDLAGTIPSLAELDAGAIIGYAPAPGLTRWIRGAEINRILSSRGIHPSGLSGLCVQRVLRMPTDEEFAAAMKQGLPPDAELEIVEHSRTPAPQGTLIFALPGLHRRSPWRAEDQEYLWRGKLIYDNHRSIPVWATVRIRIFRQVAVAVKNLTPSDVISEADIRMERRSVPPDSAGLVADPSSLVGRVPRRKIGAGAQLLISEVAEPRLISPGDRILIGVESGSVKLSVVGRALTGGRRGGMVLVENMLTGKKLQARAVRSGKAIIKVDESDNGNQASRSLVLRSIARAGKSH